jgi:type IV pilus assembly protein PilQ
VKYSIATFLMLISLFAHAQWDPFVNNGVFISQDEQGLIFQCDNINLGIVLQTLADTLNINLLLTEPLNQPVSMNMHGMSQQDILNNLLQAYQLDAIEKNNVLMILPSQQSNTIQNVKTYLLKYANAEQVAEILKSRLQTGFDARTNALIVYDVDDSFDWLQDFINNIDIPAKQVYIEATIMNASAQFSKELGLRYQLNEFSLTTLPKNIPIAVAIAAAQENHQTQVIAHTKLLTVNLQEAHIKQGKQIAYQETSASGATSLTFQEAALELKVIPMITPEHDIVLSLMVKQDVIGSLQINGQPTIDTKSIQAQVRVKDGETVVLGGIYSQIDNQQEREIPFLGRIPLIGLLFQENRALDDKDELLIFVTPRVVL